MRNWSAKKRFEMAARSARLFAAAEAVEVDIDGGDASTERGGAQECGNDGRLRSEAGGVESASTRLGPGRSC